MKSTKVNCFSWFQDYWQIRYIPKYKWDDYEYGIQQIIRDHLTGKKKYIMEDFQILMDEYDKMFKQHNYWSDSSDVRKVLRACLTAKSMIELYKENSKHFDFDTISSEQKALLLKEDYKTFKDAFDVNKLPTMYKVDLFISKPGTFKKYIDFVKVSKKDLYKIAQMHPSYFEKHNIPLGRLNGDTWSRLIGYKKTLYIPEFFKRITTIKNKSELRKLMVSKPHILPLLTPDLMRDAVLNAKEWILFLSWKEISDAGKFEYSKECCEWLDQELAIDVLSGNAINTHYVAKARTKI